jgi:hypothetical protein
VFNRYVSNSAAVFDVIDEVIAPITAVVRDRPSVMEFFDPEFKLPAVLENEPAGGGESEGGSVGLSVADEAEQYVKFVSGMAAIGLVSEGAVTPEAVGLYRALRGGFIRGAVTGVFPTRPKPWEVRFFGDEEYTTVLNTLDTQARLRSGFLSSLPGWVFDGLPERKPGPGEFLEIHADESGLIPESSAADLATIRELAARPRLGTVLVDLTVRDSILTEYPHGAFGLVDNDLGRYQFSASLNEDGRWMIGWGPATRRTAEQWIVRAVKNHA